MSVNTFISDDDLFFDETSISAPFDVLPPSPCERLGPVMRGVMAKELADMVKPGKEDDTS